MIPVELHTLIQILLHDVNVTNSEMQAHKWGCEIMNRLQEAGYRIVPAAEARS